MGIPYFPGYRPGQPPVTPVAPAPVQPMTPIAFEGGMPGPGKGGGNMVNPLPMPQPIDPLRAERYSNRPALGGGKRRWGMDRGQWRR